jgi:hypothetical protein
MPYGDDKDRDDKRKTYNDNRMPYGDDKDRDDKRKTYNDNRMPYGDDKDRDDYRKSYDDNSESFGQCSTGTQQCCESANRADSQETLDALTALPIFSLVFDKIKSSNTLVGQNCSPFWGSNEACNNVPLCCQDNSFGGLIAAGCTDFTIPIII